MRRAAEQAVRERVTQAISEATDAQDLMLGLAATRAIAFDVCQALTERELSWALAFVAGVSMAPELMGSLPGAQHRAAHGVGPGDDVVGDDATRGSSGGAGRLGEAGDDADLSASLGHCVARLSNLLGEDFTHQLGEATA
jgi:hypothetical protein